MISMMRNMQTILMMSCEWLTEVSTSSMMPATTTASQPDKATKSDKIVLNPRKRRLQAYDTKPRGPEIWEITSL